MSLIQVIAPNVNIPVEPGMCLNFVQRAFGAPWSGSTATDGWNRATKKHPDSKFPDGVAVPVWFSLTDEPAGHVVVRMADGSIYSTSHPTNKTPYHHPNMDHLLNYYSGRLRLRGWSEDLNGTRVVKENNMVEITKEAYDDFVVWKNIGLALARSKAWKGDIKENPDLVQPVLDDLQQFKWDIVASGVSASDVKSEYELITEPVYRKK